ncbi:Vacuolar protein sorting-associated protein VTA1-like protein, partial [Stegodyphus mimosarum]
MASLKVVPPNLKSIQPYLKIAEEHEKRDPAITYWCRFYAVQCGLKISDKTPGNSAFFLNLMDWLENEKKKRHDDEAITNDVVAQAHIENYALKLFLWADNEDRSGRFNKNVVKAFYTSGFIYDVANTFGDPSEEVLHHRKYAKWKATYIHNCLKNGITPVAGPIAMEGEDGETEEENLGFTPSDGGQTYNSSEQPQVPYPVGGLFNMPGYKPEGFNLPVPGAHAPPSTPNGTNQLSPTTSVTEINTQPENTGGVNLRPEDYQKAQKYCKWAGSALQYEDVPTAIASLQKALRLLTTGQDE